MAAVKMMQGDSYAVFVALRMKETGEPITPDMVSDVEIYVGDAFRKTFTAGEVLYNSEETQWFFIPSQEETFALEPGGYEVQIRIKFNNGQYSPVKGTNAGRIMILDANSDEVI